MMNVSEVARDLGLTRQMVRNLMVSGKIHFEGCTNGARNGNHITDENYMKFLIENPRYVSKKWKYEHLDTSKDLITRMAVMSEIEAMKRDMDIHLQNIYKILGGEA